VDVGLNDPACFKGITKYCEMTDPKANMTVCEAMSGFFNMQNLTAAKVTTEFFVRTCRLAVPANPAPCACLEVRRQGAGGGGGGGRPAAALGSCEQLLG
jgi:hypothetical protein